MGFPLRSNIFASGATVPEYFAKFPIQAAVLFKPSDSEFQEAFTNLFVHLDQLTGRKVAFFAVLDPPQNWMNIARGREWWRKHQEESGVVGATSDDGVLVREIARLFHLPFHSLPAIVASSNLWNAEYVAAPTSTRVIEEQLRRLTFLVEQWGEPTIGHIAEVLSDLAGFEVDYYPADERLRQQLHTTYAILCADSNGISEAQSRRSQWLAEQQVNGVQSDLDRARRGDSNPKRSANIPESQNERVGIPDSLFEDAAGRLVAPATVASRYYHSLFVEGAEDEHSLVSGDLDEESAIMIETSLRVGNFLEATRQGNLPFSDSWKGRRSFRPQPQNLDFSPGAQGALKAFEREVNLSIIQAVRSARTIKMPDFFARYRPNLAQNRSRGSGTGRDRYTGQDIYKDINELDRTDRLQQRHRFLSLGDAYHITKFMKDDPAETFNFVVDSCIQQPLPPPLLDTWKRLYNIRNEGSHTRPLEFADYQEVLDGVYSNNVLPTLLAIKRQLSRRA